jgi:hypothetical protein
LRTGRVNVHPANPSCDCRPGYPGGNQRMRS